MRDGRDPVDDFVQRYDRQILSRNSRDWFGAEGHFNVGWWEAGTRDQDVACADLVDLTIDLLLPTEGLLVDVGCGLGAGTGRLRERSPASDVLGINISPTQVADAERRYPSARFEVMDAAQLPLPPRSVGGMIAVESLLHLRSRAAFLERAALVLAPGARLVATDLLVGDRELFGSWMSPPENDLPDIASYASLAEAAGFVSVRVRDVTEHTWRPFCRRRAAAADGSLRDWFEALGARGARHYILLEATAAGP